MTSIGFPVASAGLYLFPPEKNLDSLSMATRKPMAQTVAETTRATERVK